MSLCIEHRFLVSGVITSKSLQHTISMSGHDAFSASDTNSASNSPSNAPARFEFLIPSLFVWHFSFWTQLQKNTIWIMIWMKYSSNSTEVGSYIIQYFYIAMKFEMEFMTKFEILELNLHYIVVYLQYSNLKVNNMNVLTFKYLKPLIEKSEHFDSSLVSESSPRVFWSWSSIWQQTISGKVYLFA